MIESPIWSSRIDRSIDQRSAKTSFCDRLMIDRWNRRDWWNNFLEIAVVWKLNLSLARALFCSLPLSRALLLSPLRNFFVRSSLALSEALALFLWRWLFPQQMYTATTVLLTTLNIYYRHVFKREKSSKVKRSTTHQREKPILVDRGCSFEWRELQILMREKQ